MSREIKFRRSHFLDPEKTQFHHEDFWGFGVGMTGAVFTPPSTNNTALYHIDDQFVGVQDVSGYDVYDNDIVVVKGRARIGEYVTIICWFNSGFRLKKNETYISDGILLKSMVRIIGNIHQCR